jgi:hypothetical protein
MTATLSPHDSPGASEPYVRDRATERWVEQAWMPEVPPTRDQLLTYAQTRIAALTGADAPSRSVGWKPVPNAAASLAMTLLSTVINGDDLATPQVAPTQDGGLDIQWLVCGDSLEITIDVDDGVSIVGRYDNGEDAFAPFEWIFDDDVELLYAAAVSAGSFLEKISTGVQRRMPIR